MPRPGKIRSPSIAAKPIFAFLDYRDFLAHRYRERKNREPGYSYREFAIEAGIATPSMLKAVLDGHRNLARHAIDNISRSLGLRAKERKYFRSLIDFNQAATLAEKQRRYAALITMGESMEGNALRINQENALDNARLAMHALPKDKRHVSTLTLGVSDSTYAAMEAELLAFKDRIRTLIQSDKRKAHIYQFTLALFPASRPRE